MDPAAFAEALGSAQRGDDQGFAIIWRALNPPLLRYLRVAVGPTENEDLAAVVWMDAVRALNGFEGDGDGFRGWLFTIARRRVIDFRRAGARRPSEPSADLTDQQIAQGADPADLAGERLSTDAALDLIGTLNPDQAEAVALRVLADLDAATVGEILGKPPGTVRVLTHRGLRQLADTLGAQDFAEEL